MKPTRQHIADKALQLFNDKGFVNVRLQHIADAAFVSIGHLAYHFKNKDQLLEYLYSAIRTEKEALLNEHKVLPLFEDIGRMLEQLYGHQMKYRFFYTDLLEISRSYPQLSNSHQHHTVWQRMQLSLMLEFNAARGAMTLPQGDAALAVKLLQRFLDNWLHNVLTGPQPDTSLQAFMSDAWQALRVCFTNMGDNEYRQYMNGKNSAA